MQLDDSAAVVTGAASGLGAATAATARCAWHPADKEMTSA